MNALLDIFDLGENMRRSVDGIKHLRGAAARSQALTLLLICAALAAPLWYFDLDPTSVWSIRAAEGISSGALAGAASLIYVLFLALPTAAQFGLARLAMSGFKMAEIFAYAAAVFDAFTDWPRVVTTMQSAWNYGMFEAFGPVARVAYWLGHALLLLMATTGLELIFVVCLVCAVVCLKNSTGVAKKGTKHEQPAGA